MEFFDSPLNQPTIKFGNPTKNFGYPKDINQLKAICIGKNAISNVSREATLEPLEQLEQLVVKNPNINLKDNERCYYQQRASAHHKKNVVVGTKREGAGLSFRFSKDFTLHTGGGGSTTIRDDISELFDGTLYITNQRIILVAAKYGFDLRFDKITSLSVLGNGLRLFTGSKCYEVYTEDVKHIEYVLALIEYIPPIEKEQSSRKPTASSIANDELNQIGIKIDM